VSAVDAVEVTDADERGTEVAGNVVEFVEINIGKSSTAETRRTPRSSYSKNLGVLGVSR